MLAALESASRAILTSVFPVLMYRSLQSSQAVSDAYLVIGIVSMAAALLTPWATRFLPRRWTYTAAALLMIVGNLIAVAGGSYAVPIGLGLNTIAVVVLTTCFNAYVMDYVERSSLGRCETLRLFYSGAAWTLGPFVGIWMMGRWAPAPFFISIGFCLILLGAFWIMRLGNGKIIARARAPSPNPLGYFPRLLAQPRLVAGWTFAVIRSCGWWVYVVYLPIYAVENGYGEHVGGLALSLTNCLLFTTPFMLRWMQSNGVRRTVVLGFFGSGLLFLAVSVVSTAPSIVIALLILGSAFLILLDVSAGLPFLMAVKPSERTEMSAVYSTYRDVSGVVTPAVGRAVLSVSPLIGVFVASGFGLAVCGWLALKLHPRLGVNRMRLAPREASRVQHQE